VPCRRPGPSRATRRRMPCCEVVPKTASTSSQCQEDAENCNGLVCLFRRRSQLLPRPSEPRTRSRGNAKGSGIYSPNGSDELPSMTTLSLRFLWWTLLLVCIARVQAGTRTITVDDAATNLISYSKGWNKGELCEGCAAKPDKSKARDGTWHE
jgi:hypothetical protein